MKQWCLLLALLAMACDGSSDTGLVQTELEPTVVAEGKPISVSNTLGPVTALVTVSPASPLIGDIMSLTLEVDVLEGVQLTMPESREAFSRLSIDDEDEGSEVTDTGRRYFQSYQIQASSSGRLRIPHMRLVFIDQREGQDTKSEERELLTDEIAIKVRAVLEGEEASNATLRPIRTSLEENLGPSLWQQYWWAILGGIAALLVIVGLFLVRRSRKVAQISPYERASVALSELELEGLPDDEARDGWYVELSSIVRLYLEDRFGLRAPELTTEEFLRVAQRSSRISDSHKTLLSSFLADCDKVKFAGYEPGDEESRSVLEAARRFLLETRVLDTEGGEPQEEVAATPSDTEAA